MAGQFSILPMETLQPNPIPLPGAIGPETVEEVGNQVFELDPNGSGDPPLTSMQMVKKKDNGTISYLTALCTKDVGTERVSFYHTTFVIDENETGTAISIPGNTLVDLAGMHVFVRKKLSNGQVLCDLILWGRP